MTALVEIVAVVIDCAAPASLTGPEGHVLCLTTD
jgi:hypothetical protein